MLRGDVPRDASQKYCVAAWLWASHDRELSAETVHIFVNVTTDGPQRTPGSKAE